MLLPDNINPEQTIYYNGSFVLKVITGLGVSNLLDLYMRTIQEKEMTMSVFTLCLDWLFLIGMIELNPNGMVALCS